eukprot:CAMPEP_0198240332 /NCGR_PEP_ID=MMETSP1446-20131203/5482_1 /TAXON_ID=1461542 ORGANISM="Unidentified sp, Strain CCMP2111" /NCGR_SAMPLE_ID=MMETSP1446 /ASSEMBLY_ACC=CAM_ASM_001112 /LENGTH=494 /DNA_ID=CAMNT_0043923051 /DNA_START=55 /DNA_END=1539 /DNA_ORIENTATION=+
MRATGRTVPVVTRSRSRESHMNPPGDKAIQRAEVRRARRMKASSSSSSASPGGDNPQKYPKSFYRVRIFTFVGILVGYACYYLTRNSLTYTAPVMVASDLGLDVASIGTMTSIFPIAYGMSKFVSGVLGSMMSASRLLGLGLMLTGAVNIIFGFGSSLAWFCTFWALNGILQGFGGPCCARILTSWFATKERGTYWGMWNIAHNLGGFTAPLLAGTAASRLGWQWGMWAPGIIGTIVGAVLFVGIKEKPESAGFDPVEDTEVAATGENEKKESIRTILFENVLKNPFIWGMALTYFFVYVIRQGVTSWFVFYLLQEKGAVDAGAAAARVSGLELGGLFGSLLAGRLSDMAIANSEGSGVVGKRVQVVIAYTVGIAASLIAFRGCPASWPAAQWACIFTIGFFLYGPQMLIGLCGAELVGPASVGASEGFLGWVAYLGAANAGVPLSIIVRDYGWNTYFATLLAACAAVIVLMAPMVRLKSFVQRERAETKRKLT